MLHGKNILLVENDTSLRDALTIVLQAEHYAVYASDTKHYVNAMHGLQLTVAIVDVPYRKLGKDVKKIVSDIKKHNSKIHILLSSTDPQVEGMTRQLGGNDFLEEPFDIDVLFKKVVALTSYR